MSDTEWLAKRATCLTASDIAGVMGLDSHKSRQKVLAEKIANEPSRDISRIPAVAAGRHLESGILSWFAEDHQEEYYITTADANVGLPLFDSVRGRILHIREDNGQALIHSPVISRLAATPDGYCLDFDGNLRLIEVKCVDKPWVDGKGMNQPVVRAWNQGRAALGTAAPLKYWVQLQCQMHCVGVEQGWLTGLQGAHSRADRLYSLDKDFEARMLSAVEEFIAEWDAHKALEG